MPQNNQDEIQQEINHLQQEQQQGGSMLEKVAVPGVLYIANELYKRNSRKFQKSKGGSALGTIAAPGVLFVANELYKRRKTARGNKSFRKTRKYRGTRRYRRRR